MTTCWSFPVSSTWSECQSRAAQLLLRPAASWRKHGALGGTESSLLVFRLSSVLSSSSRWFIALQNKSRAGISRQFWLQEFEFSRQNLRNWEFEFSRLNLRNWVSDSQRGLIRAFDSISRLNWWPQMRASTVAQIGLNAVWIFAPKSHFRWFEQTATRLKSSIWVCRLWKYMSPGARITGRLVFGAKIQKKWRF